MKKGFQPFWRLENKMTDKTYYLKISRNNSRKSWWIQELYSFLHDYGERKSFTYNAIYADRDSDLKKTSRYVILAVKNFYFAHRKLRGEKRENALNKVIKFINAKGYKTKAFDLEGIFDKI